MTTTTDPRKGQPYQVRKQTSGRSWDTYIVVRNPGGRRVSVHPFTSRHAAQASADALNIGAMVEDHADDPRPYAERRAEAEAAYRAMVGN